MGKYFLEWNIFLTTSSWWCLYVIPIYMYRIHVMCETIFSHVFFFIIACALLSILVTSPRAIWHIFYVSNYKALVKRTGKQSQVDASWTCVETCVGQPNGLAGFLVSTRKSPKKPFKADILCISLANNRLMGVTQIGLTWVGWPASTWVQIWSRRKWAQLHCKSTQGHARSGQKES